MVGGWSFGRSKFNRAVQALRLGATDYMVKPVDVERLRSVLQPTPETDPSGAGERSLA